MTKSKETTINCVLGRRGEGVRVQMLGGRGEGGKGADVRGEGGGG